MHRRDRYKALTAGYLRAASALGCDYLEYPDGSGVYVKPEELPSEGLDRFRAIYRDGWKLGTIAEQDDEPLTGG